jgi:transposase
MRLTLTESQRAELEAAATAEQGVRRWKRYRAVLLRGEGWTVAATAATLQCSEASVYAWTAAWRRAGAAGLRDGDHGGGKAKLDAAAEAVRSGLLERDPQSLGQRATARAMLAAGGEVWVAAETGRRECPPLRAAWSQRGAPAAGLISGRNGRRPILGALNVRSGELVATMRERGRADDVLAAVAARPRRAPGDAQAAGRGQRPAAPPAPGARRGRGGGHHAGLPALPFAGVDAAGGPVARPQGHGVC